MFLVLMAPSLDCALKLAKRLEPGKEARDWCKVDPATRADVRTFLLELRPRRRRPGRPPVGAGPG